ncbi:MAG: glycosyltransferase [Chitinophagaceae bacterium]|nr:glycosyltransferase [Chitinophagaceae bacterium]
MTPLKNVAGILQAMENVLHHVPNTELILVGDIRNELVKQVQSSPQLKNQVIFTGVLSYSEVANQIKQAHALVLFSDSESQSCVVLEALCSGRPCIVPATGGVQELIDDHNGFKVNVRDTEHLAIKMIDLQQKYSQYNFQRISEQAIAQYSYEKVGMEFKTLYDRNFQ